MHGDAYMPCEPVAATHRQNTHRCLRMAQTVRHLVHCAVAAYGHHRIEAHTSELPRQFRRVPLPLRIDDVRQPLLTIQRLLNQLRQFTLILRSRYRVDDKGDIFHCIPRCFLHERPYKEPLKHILLTNY